MVRYIAGGGRPAAAVAGPLDDPRLGRTVTPLPNNKTNIYYTRSADEAHYLAGWINSYSAQATLERYSASTGITPAALERLAIPAWDGDDGAHRRVVEAAVACQSAAGTNSLLDLAVAWTEVDLSVAALAGVRQEIIPSRDAGHVADESFADILAEVDVAATEEPAALQEVLDHN